VDVAGEIAEAADAVSTSPALASPEGDWRLFFEVDGRESFLEKVGQDGAVARFRTKSLLNNPKFLPASLGDRFSFSDNQTEHRMKAVCALRFDHYSSGHTGQRIFALDLKT
jgi:hypothetical protein